MCDPSPQEMNDMQELEFTSVDAGGRAFEGEGNEG